MVARMKVTCFCATSRYNVYPNTNVADRGTRVLFGQVRRWKNVRDFMNNNSSKKNRIESRTKGALKTNERRAKRQISSLRSFLSSAVGSVQYFYTAVMDRGGGDRFVHVYFNPVFRNPFQIPVQFLLFCINYIYIYIFLII